MDREVSDSVAVVTRDLRRVCVFCGSSPGNRTSFTDAARTLGTLLAEQGIGVVYGGANIGLMHEVADAALAAGGEVIGVMPRVLVEVEIDHRGLTDLHLVDTMAERKALMAELSDAFVALPGGLGTLEELFEMVVLTQLHLHDKPAGVLDVDGFYDHLRAFLDRAVDDALLTPANRALVLFDDDPARLLDRLRTHDADPAGKWLGR